MSFALPYFFNLRVSSPLDDGICRFFLPGYHPPLCVILKNRVLRFDLSDITGFARYDRVLRFDSLLLIA